MSDAELLAGLGSVAPAAGVTVAVLDSVPVAPVTIVADTVKVTEAPTGKLTTSLIAPVPLGAQAPMHVQVTPLSPAGTLSVTVAPSASEGPLFVATIVYVMPVPGTAVVALSVLVIARSVVATSVSTSVAVLSSGDVSVTVAGTVAVTVFDSVPAAAALMLMVTR